MAAIFMGIVASSVAQSKAEVFNPSNQAHQRV